LRELLDPAVIEQTELELQRLAPDRKAKGDEGLIDLLRILGPLSTEELELRWSSSPEGVSRPAALRPLDQLLADHSPHHLADLGPR
jgi:ATP-dependent Lhr-like helicase